MHRLSVTVAVALAPLVIAAPGCSKDGDTGKKLDELSAKIDGIDKRVAKMEGFLKPYMNQPPPPPEPDPAATYSVPVDGNFGFGPATAPVTIVEAFDYG